MYVFIVILIITEHPKYYSLENKQNLAERTLLNRGVYITKCVYTVLEVEFFLNKVLAVFTWLWGLLWYGMIEHTIGYNTYQVKP